MIFDPTIGIVSLIALVSVVSPILTAIINNRYALKLKKMENEDELRRLTTIHKREIIENALSDIGLAVRYGTQETIHVACKSIFLASAYVDNEVHNDLIKFSMNSYSDNGGDMNTDYFIKLTGELKLELSKLKI